MRFVCLRGSSCIGHARAVGWLYTGIAVTRNPICVETDTSASQACKSFHTTVAAAEHVAVEFGNAWCAAIKRNDSEIGMNEREMKKGGWRSQSRGDDYWEIKKMSINMRIIKWPEAEP